MVLPASLFVASVSNQLIELFTGGGSYLSGSGPLEIIGIFYFFPATQLVAYSVLQATGKTNVVLTVGAITAVTGVAASLILIPFLKLNGAALSTSIVGLIGSSSSMYFAREYAGRLHNKDNLYFYAKSIIASGVPFGALYVLSSLFHSHGLLTLFPYFAIGALIYIIMLRALRIVNEEDRTYLEHLLGKRARRILSYI